MTHLIDFSTALQSCKTPADAADVIIAHLGTFIGAKVTDALCFLHDPRRSSPIAPLEAHGRFEEMLEDASLIPAPIIAAVQSCQGEMLLDLVLPDQGLLLLHEKVPPVGYGIVFHTDRALTKEQLGALKEVCPLIAASLENSRLFEQDTQAQLAAVMTLAKVCELRDDSTGEHVFRVYRTVERLVRLLKKKNVWPDVLTPKFISRIGPASMLHDIGKIALTDEILLKPSAFTPEERKIMETHVTVGANILQTGAKMVEQTPYLSMAAEIALNHHERPDGKGYPAGLKGEEIPVSARIVAVAEVFDALTNTRPHKEPWPEEKAVSIIAEGAGTQFDAQVVEAFLELVKTNRL